MLRPASRRASQQNASPDRPHPSPYESDPAPYRPDRAPYGPPNGTPDRAPYGPPNGTPDRAPYGPPDGTPDRARYGPPPNGPRGRGPYGPPNGPRGRAPYGPPNGPELDTQVFPRIPSGPVPGEPDAADGGPARPTGRKERRAQRRARRRGRIRRLLRRRTVQVILALIAAFCCWLAFSVGSALAAPGGGSVSSKLAEWARDHYLGPVVTFGEWLSYQPPKAGGKPSFSLAVPSTAPTKYKHVKGFQPIIPKRLASPAGTPLAGEGQWRVLETVKGQPAMFSTLLRPSSVYTSYVAGIISIDQRLVSFQLRPGSEDPGSGFGKAQSWIPPGTRTGLLGTFNGGFKLDSSGGGFYLNGVTHGVLIKGAASVVYYRNGTIKIGVWGRDVKMTSSVVGVRQNLKLIVDHGQVAADLNQDVQTKWGATLGGGYYVWRSGMGITKDGRVIFVYGPALNVQELADLLHEAGAVEALQLDINPEWTSFEYYKTSGHPSDPTPVAVLPNQEASAYRYYSVFSRDFTAVYAK